MKKTILQKYITSSLSAVLCLSVFINLPSNHVQAFSSASGSYNSLSAADKAAFSSKVANPSSIQSVSVSGPSISVEGKTPSSYQWTAWYNANVKDFSINKSLTDGNYRVGVPTRTSSRQLQTNLVRVGYYKYLSDPIYSQIRLKAAKTFTYTTVNTKLTSEQTTNEKIYVKTFNALSTKAKKYKIIKQSQINGIINARKNKQKNNQICTSHSGYTGNAGQINVKEKPFTVTWLNTGTISTSNYKEVKTIIDTANKKVVETKIYTGAFEYYVPMCSKESGRLTLKTRTYTTTYETHSKTVEVANTVVAQNVSATELSKYASFKLVSKNGGTGAVNTAVSKSNSGWWGANRPSYHQGNSTTSDSSGTFYYWSNSQNGTNATNLRNYISQKEKLHEFKATATNQVVAHKYTLSINPNGGTYKGNHGITSIKQSKPSTYTVDIPARDGYQFAGWDFSGSGQWNPATNKYIFGEGDATLTAKWVEVPQPDKNIKYTLTIDPNGGKYKSKTTPTTVTKSQGDIYGVTNPTRNGYTFIGWQVVSGNSACLSQGTDNSVVRFYDNLSIKAQWIKNKEGDASVKIDPNGGTYEGSTNIKTISGKTGETTFITKPSRPGYVFAGWEVSNLDKNKFNGSNFTFVRGNTVLKARWELLNIPNCIIGGTGANACPTDDEEVKVWFYLTKNLG